MTTSWLGARRVALPSCASTNDEAAALARRGAAHGTIVLADAQTAGRGRLGRTWWSPPGNVFLSAVLRLAVAPAALPPLTLAVGLGVRAAAAALGVTDAAVKWPNDVGVFRGTAFVKLAGVLTETVSRGGTIDAVIVGVGVNVDGTPPPELAAIATSIGAERGTAATRAEVLDALLPALEGWIDRFAEGGASAIAAAFRRDAGFLGRDVAVASGATRRAGRVVDVDDDGALVLEAEGRRDRVVAGEVSAWEGSSGSARRGAEAP